MGGLGAAFAAMLVAVTAGGEARMLGLVGLQAGPLLVLCGLAQLGQRHPGLRAVSWTWFGLVLVGVAFVSLGLAAAGGLATDPTTGTLEPGLTEALDQGSSSQASAEGSLALVGLTGVLLLGLVGVAVAVASRGWIGLGRRLGAAVHRPDAGHAQALVGLLFFILAAVAPLVFLPGHAPLLVQLARGDGAEVVSGLAPGLEMLYLAVWAAPLALLGAGFPLRRSFREALARLGLGPLRRSEILVLPLVVLGLLVLGTLAGRLTDQVWLWMGWPATDGALVRSLLGAPTSSPIGILCIGLSAGFAEEIVVRGLLQPRLGWLLPNAAFAAAHAFQYGLDGLVVVFLIGGAQAVVRARWNTTAAVATHAGYDIAVLTLALVSF